MIKDWLKHRLTPEKQKSTLWCEFTDSLQAVLETTVEPLLERISNRKSIFTMHPDDLDKRIAELGKFFIIRTDNAKSKPVLLSQRLDEIHFKGTERPISSTFWREFNNLPATWSPLWAPVDQTHFPYGTVLLPKNLADAAQSRYGEFFLTSRGVIQLSLNTLYEQYGYKEQAKLFSRLTRQFDQIIAPLIPLEIVFNGFHFFFYFTITEEAELLRLRQSRLLIDAKFNLQDVVNTLSGATRQLKVPNQVIRAIIRPLKQTTHRFDTMPLDAWALDLHHTPPIIPEPFGTQPDPRFHILDNQIWISTEGHYGCRVSLKGERLRRYSFPSWAKKAFLPIPVEQIPLIEKITYCVMPEFILYDVPLTEWRDTVRLTRKTAQIRLGALTETADMLQNRQGRLRLAPDIRLKDPGEAIRLTRMMGNRRLSALREHRETVENPRFHLGLSSLLSPIAWQVFTRLTLVQTRLFDTLQLTDKPEAVNLDQTVEKITVRALAEHREAVENIRVNTGLSSRLAPVEFQAFSHLTLTQTRLFDTLQLTDERETMNLAQTVKKIGLSAIAEHCDQMKNRQVSAELSSRLAPVEFQANTTRLHLDDVPLDMWALDVNVLAPPVFKGDRRLREDAGRVMLDMAGQRGCLVHYADGQMSSYEFPPGATVVQLPADGGHTFHDIVKIVFV